ncbi:hypothetical protein ADEAN_000311100 [Angomonas deanei]|uniref:Uncharacterized protein n=1 Tax=Angomonas deanei TaxID=59799 RepID=A0A7G2C7C9_9TRYP|nr:hypothetical protein ADEAN_000311100 [Angomonas deanei]
MSETSSSGPESTLDYDSNEITWEEENDDASSSFSADEEDILLAPQRAILATKHTMKRIIAISKLIKTEKENIEKSTASNEELEQSEKIMQNLVFTARYLYGNLANFLITEFHAALGAYSETLDDGGKISFSSVTHTIHDNDYFCEVLATLLDTAVEGRPYPEEPFSELQRSILRKYYEELGKIQYSAIICSWLLVVGSKEHFLEPLNSYELCKLVVEEKLSYKRLVPLSLLNSMIRQDDQALNEAYAQNVPKFLLQRLRNLAHSIYGQFSRSDFVYDEYSRLANHPENSTSYPDSPVPSADQTFRNSPRKRDRSRNRSPMMKRLRLEETDELYLDQWFPQHGDKVARGPCWSHGEQGRNCNFGEVVGITSDDEVAVKWIANLDAKPGTSDGDCVFLYKYKSPNFEVCYWKHALRANCFEADPFILKQIELRQVCQLISTICNQRDVIQPTFQNSAVEWLLHILDSTDLTEDKKNQQEAYDKFFARERERFAPLCLSEEALNTRIEKMTQYDAKLCKAAFKSRDTLGCVLKVLDALSTLVSQRKIALKFISLNGVGRVLKLATTLKEAECTYYCSLLLANLCREIEFEKILRDQFHLFNGILEFMFTEWKTSDFAMVRENCVRFISRVVTFPCVLEYFDKNNCADFAIHSWAALLKTSEEEFDVMGATLHEYTIKLLKFYVVTHLIQATKVVFFVHPKLSFLAKSDPYTSLFKEPAVIDAVLGFLVNCAYTPSGISVENIHSLLTSDNVTAISALIDKNLHSLLSQSANFYYLQGKYVLLNATLQLEGVLTVAPFVRPLVVRSESHDSMLMQLVTYIGDLSSVFIKSNYSKENQALLCAISSSQILLHVTEPPLDGDDESAVSIFNTICRAFRDCGGIKTLLDIVKVRLDSTMSIKLMYFPLVTRAVQLLVTLRRYGDTEQLFEALGVHRIMQELLIVYGDVQKEHISVMRERKLYIELDSASRFIDNVKSFASDGASQLNVVRVNTVDPLEAEQRNLIVSRAVVDYSKKSLLQLIQQYLRNEGLADTAATLSNEAHLSKPDADGTTNSNPSLDTLVKTYLRQQQEKCPTIIETLPEFDLTKRHVYAPLPPPPDETKSALNRLLLRKTSFHRPLKMTLNENALKYRFPTFMFDISGGGDGIDGESIAFCDDGETVVVGTSEGAIALFDTFPEEASEEKQLEQHLVFENDPVKAIAVSRDGQLIGATNESGFTKVMRRNQLPVVVQELECRAIRFSHDNLFALTTNDDERACTLVDLESQQLLRTFSDQIWSTENYDNVAIFNFTSNLILNDGILWDVRTNEKPVFRFDRITQSLASTFHPNNNLVIIDEMVWDLRTWKIVQTVPTFYKTSSYHMSDVGNVIYGFRAADPAVNPFPIVSVVDSYSLNSIFSDEVRPAFKSFAVDPSDRYCAAILSDNDESIIRMFLTSSGPFADHSAFASPLHGTEDEENPGGESDTDMLGEIDDDEEYTDFDDEDDEEEEDDFEPGDEDDFAYGDDDDFGFEDEEDYDYDDDYDEDEG